MNIWLRLYQRKKELSWRVKGDWCCMQIACHLLIKMLNTTSFQSCQK